MSEDARYKMQHLGDIFADALSIVADSAKKHAKGIVLTYDIHDLKKKKLQCLGLIGRRVAEVKKAGPADLKKDDHLTELIAKAEIIDKYIASLEKKMEMTLCGCVSKIM